MECGMSSKSGGREAVSGEVSGAVRALEAILQPCADLKGFAVAVEFFSFIVRCKLIRHRCSGGRGTVNKMRHACSVVGHFLPVDGY
eukprot:2190118-Rhodomonas_salina.1